VKARTTSLPTRKAEFIEPMECASVSTLPDVVPATRRMIYEKLKPLITDKCPFVNLPETGRARWGEILDAEKMKQCVWVRPKA